MVDLDAFGLEPWETGTCRPGDKFGMLTVKAIGKAFYSYRYYAICQCDCGSPPKRIRIDKLVGSTGLTKTCGCVPKNFVHGLSYHPCFRVWRSMMSRCYDTKVSQYPRWGGRGITVCERWHDVRNFVDDMSPTYRKGLQIERIDNDGNYNIDNCRWATRGEQANNKRSNVNLTFQGKTMSLARWSRTVGINYGTLWDRIKVLRWSAERALTTPALDADTRCAIARDARQG